MKFNFSLSSMKTKNLIIYNSENWSLKKNISYLLFPYRILRCDLYDNFRKKKDIFSSNLKSDQPSKKITLGFIIKSFSLDSLI